MAASFDTMWKEQQGRSIGCREDCQRQAALMLLEILSEAHASSLSNRQLDIVQGSSDPDDNICDAFSLRLGRGIEGWHAGWTVTDMQRWRISRPEPGMPVHFLQ